MPTPAVKPLSATSAAVLGMLSVQSWTGYELTQQMKRSLRFCWAKNDSVLYEEPRRLVREGLAAVTTEEVGGRTRQRYTITRKGRSQLKAWLATPPEPPKIEMEAMLRLLYSDQAGVAELRAAVDSLRAWAETLLAAGSSMVSGYLRDGGPFPNRLHISMLFARYFADLYGMTRDWADLADAEIDSWNGQTKDLGMTPGGRTIAEDLMRRFPPPSQLAGDQMS